MKKLLFVLCGLILVAIITAVVFFATFDINRYKGAIETNIGSAIGNPVQIGRLSLAWKGMIVLEIDGVNVYESTKEGDPVIAVEKMNVALELFPLLHKEVKVSSVSVSKPRLSIVREKNGAVTVRGVALKQAPQGGKASAQAMPPVTFLIQKVTITGGEVRYQDLALTPPVDLTVRAIDVELRNVSLDGEIGFDAKAALFSRSQNVRFAGSVGGFSRPPLRLSNFSVDLDLNAIDSAELVRAVPAMAQSLQPGLEGRVSAKVDELELAEGKLSKLSASFDLSGGKVVVTQAKVPIDSIALKATLAAGQLVVDECSARVVNAVIKGQGKVERIFEVPLATFALDIQAPRVNALISQFSGKKGYLDGDIGLSLSGTATGKTPQELTQTVSGKGTFTLTNGVLLNFNVLKQSLGSLTMFPGLLDTVQGMLPPAVQKALSEEYTLLKPVKQDFVVEKGVVDLSALHLATDICEVNGEAKADFSGSVNGTGAIVFDKVLTDALIGAVGQMKSLENKAGLVEFPITFKVGPGGNSLMPDFKYIGTQLALAKGQELIGDLLSKGEGQKAGQAAPSQASAQTQGAGSSSSSMDNVLNKLKSFTADMKTDSTASIGSGAAK